MTLMTWGKRDDMIVHTAEPLNAEPPAAALAQAELTPADTFYVRNHGIARAASPAAQA
jgi:sulfite oxidase